MPSREIDLSNRRASNTVTQQPPQRSITGKDAQGQIETPAPDHEEIARLAYRLYEERGSQDGSPDEDWYRAEEQLRHRRHSRTSLA